jgi:metal-dependent amidase/aminoacylase/carboxypeptidase family protein
MAHLVEVAQKLVGQHATKHGLKYDISWTEEFLATENNREATIILEEAAKSINLEVIYKDEPFRWSEDFSHFTVRYPGTLFGLGSGENCPQLHNPDYDFPEDIIEPGINVFNNIYQKYLKK